MTTDPQTQVEELLDAAEEAVNKIPRVALNREERLSLDRLVDAIRAVRD